MSGALTALEDPSQLISESPAYKQHEFLKQLAAAMKDPGLSPQDKELLQKRISQPGFVEKVMHGSMGAVLAMAFAKFMKMSKETQVMMSMMGFGLGNMLLEASEKASQSGPVTYDKEKHTYNIH